jgi:hypothetical protein
MTEHQIQKDILLALGQRPDLCTVWRQNTGMARPLNSPNQVVRYGVNGAADISGILVDGRRLEVEVKSATGRQSKEQAAFQRMITARNGVYILARSVDEALAAVQEALHAV